MIDPVKIYLKDSDILFYELGFTGGLYAQIKDLTFKQALWKPSEDRHCIWEIVRHINFWKKYMASGVLGEKPGEPDSESWTQLPKNADASKWKDEIEYSIKVHEDFKKAAEKLSEKLYEIEKDDAAFFRQVLYHDAYHTGQIGMLRVMQGLKPVE
jgi:hypothetical protein